MIGWLRGIVRARTEDGVLVDVGGVGYEVGISLTTLAALPGAGKEVTLWVHTQVREDAITLFGFHDPDERVAFRILIEVNGVGPRLALAILGSFTPRGLSQALAGGDVRRLTQVPGIGKKTAERLVLELRDRLPRALEPVGAEPVPVGAAPADGGEAPGGILADLGLALQSLGYRKAEIERILRGIRVAPEDTVEGLLRRALKELGPK